MVSQRGSALITVLGVAALVAVMALALASVVVNRQNITRSAENRARAQALADAALAESLAGLAGAPEHYAGFPERRWGRGLVNSSIGRDSGSEVVTVRAEGSSGGVRVRLDVVVRVDDDHPPVVLSWQRAQTVRP